MGREYGSGLQGRPGADGPRVLAQSRADVRNPRRALAPCHTVGLVLCRRKAKDAISVIREPVLSLEQKTSAKRSQLRVAWAKGQAVTALSGSMRQS